MDIKLNGIAIKQPTNLVIERYNITNAKRLASGKMMMDLIAKKRKFNLTYEVLAGRSLDQILAIIDSNQMFFTLTYTENDTVKTATVYCGQISAQKFRTTGGWYWKNVTFNLIEQ